MSNSIQSKLNEVASKIGHCKGIAYEIKDGLFCITVIGREYKAVNAVTCKAESLKAAASLAISRAARLNIITHKAA